MDIISSCYVSVKRCFGRVFLHIDPVGLRELAERAFFELSYYLRPSYLKKIASILDDHGSSNNDRFVAASLLQNAVIAADGVLPLCQDTGTAQITAWKGERVQTNSNDADWLSKGIKGAYTKNPFRFSQIMPLSMFEELNSGTNLPAQIDISSVEGDEYEFLFVAKGGGSANKTAFYAETPAILAKEALTLFLKQKIPSIGVAACPPYILSVVIGGTSPECNLKINKMTSTGSLDHLPAKGSGKRAMYRDIEWERVVMDIAEKSGLGAQFIGKHFAIDARVIRLSRHAASVPISIGVSCNAHRNITGRITKEGVFLERLEKNPAKYFDKCAVAVSATEVVDLNRPIDELVAIFGKYSVGKVLSLDGNIIVARDAAHARWYRRLQSGKNMPDYLVNSPIYYAGPANTPKTGNFVSGSFGPTTAARMDAYLESLLRVGLSRITIAKGNRSPFVSELCRKYNGFYFGTVGGAAALIAKNHIVESRIIDYHELGMEAVRLIRVHNLPVIMICDNKGNNLYSGRSY